ncbi:YitT family protein [Mycoplasmopsis gallopavonis]|nr:YitT family protein [Mycoplasmopsis gallopavonis]
MREIAQAGSFKDSEVIQGIFNLKDKTQMTQFLTDKKEIINNFLASNDSAANAFANALIYKLNDLKLINNAETITKIQGQMENIGIAQEFNSVLNQFQKLTAITSKAWNFEIYLSPNFVATILTNVVYIITLNKLYPKFKLVRLEIFSDKWEQIRDIINQDEKIVTGMTIFKARGGYRDKEINVITSVSLFRHVVRVIKTVHIVDPNAFVSISDVSSIDGYVYLPEDKF